MTDIDKNKAFDYIAWLCGITEGEFQYFMCKSGHKNKSYIKEKWMEFSGNKLMFSYQWHEELFTYHLDIASQHPDSHINKLQ